MEQALTGRAAGDERDAARLSARLVALFVPAALLTAALGSEYIGGLVPCEMCWWQRYAHMAALLPAGLAFTAPRSAPRSRIFVWLAALAIACSGLIGAYHAGVELGIFEGVTICTSLAAGTSSEDLLKSIMNAPLVRCDQVQWSFLGISMAGWNAILSLSAAALVSFLLVREKRA